MPLPPQTSAIPGLQQSALDIIKSALRLINVLGAGANPSASESEDALTILNQMIDAWQIDRLMIYTVNRQALDMGTPPQGSSPAIPPAPFTLQSGKQAYTVGAGGDFNFPRPARIDSTSVIYLSNAEQPLELELEDLTDDQWQSIPVKNTSSTFPRSVWNDLGFPFLTLSFWPIPTQANQIVFYMWQVLQYFPNLSTKLTFPPGYLECLRYNLAVRLAPEFGKEQINPVVAAVAIESMGKIRSFNIPITEMRLDPALSDNGGGYYDWRSDRIIRR